MLKKILILSLIIVIGGCSKPCDCSNKHNFIDSLKIMAYESDLKKAKEENAQMQHTILEKDRILARERATNHSLLQSVRAINKTISEGFADRDSTIRQ